MTTPEPEGGEEAEAWLTIGWLTFIGVFVITLVLFT